MSDEPFLTIRNAALQDAYVAALGRMDHQTMLIDGLSDDDECPWIGVWRGSAKYNDCRCECRRLLDSIVSAAMDGASA